MSVAEANKVVCVTGASGYIASWLVKFLLQRGYTVKASVRDPNDKKKTEHLLALEGAKERLHLLKADLTEEGSFDSAVEGCEVVFHTASPFSHIVTDPQEELIDPAVKGTLNVLRSCAKVPSVKRVIVTSSMAAVAFNENSLAPDVVIDENWFSDPAFCEKSKLWCALSKTLAEETAWKFVEENGIDMIAINPGLVIGPLLQPTINSSVERILNLVKGIQISHTVYNRWVDVRDVANAHIQAFENPLACGRYCLVAQVADCSEVLKMLRELYPALNLSEKVEYDRPYEPTYQVSMEKAESLGINLISLKTSLRDTIGSLKEKHFLSF